MKPAYLQKFTSLDSQLFMALMRHLGYRAAACYRLATHDVTQVLSSDTKSSDGLWPSALPYVDDYTAKRDGLPLLGWIKLKDAGYKLKDWPKGTRLYFPEQRFTDVKLMFALITNPNMRLRQSDLNGPLEAIATRIRGWLREGAERSRVSEAYMQEHAKIFGNDLSMLVDHELRTPLASIFGYTLLIGELELPRQAREWEDYSQILKTQTTYALEALDKLSLMLKTNVPASMGQLDEGIDVLDVAEEVNYLCSEAKSKAIDFVGAEAAMRTTIKCSKSSDLPCMISAKQSQFRSAIWEVLKNAVIHSRSGDVFVEIYRSGNVVVIEVEDDGQGVSQGSEELIFLRFYQDPATHVSRKGKRGLGLGLFLARKIVERHLGQLNYVRKPHRGGVFRFLWPLYESESDSKMLPDDKLSKGA